MNKIGINIFLMLLMAALNIDSSLAQEVKKGGYGNYRFGIYNWGAPEEGIINILEGAYIKDERIYSAGFMSAVEIFGPFKMYAVDVLYGKHIDGKYVRFQYQAGLGMLWGNVKQKYAVQDDMFFTVGIPVKTGFKYMPFKFMIMGIDLQVNVNMKKVLYMPMLSFEFGKVR